MRASESCMIWHADLRGREEKRETEKTRAQERKFDSSGVAVVWGARAPLT